MSGLVWGNDGSLKWKTRLSLLTDVAEGLLLFITAISFTLVFICYLFLFLFFHNAWQHVDEIKERVEYKQSSNPSNLYLTNIVS